MQTVNLAHGSSTRWAPDATAWAIGAAGPAGVPLARFFRRCRQGPSSWLRGLR